MPEGIPEEPQRKPNSSLKGSESQQTKQYTAGTWLTPLSDPRGAQKYWEVIKGISWGFQSCLN